MDPGVSTGVYLDSSLGEMDFFFQGEFWGLVVSGLLHMECLPLIFLLEGLLALFPSELCRYCPALFTFSLVVALRTPAASLTPPPTQRPPRDALDRRISFGARVQH